MRFITKDPAFSSFPLPDLSTQSINTFIRSGKLTVFSSCQENSFLSLLRSLLLDLIYPFVPLENHSLRFYHSSHLRSLLTQTVKDPFVINEVLRINYIQLITVEKLQSCSPEEIMTFSGVEESITIKHKEWIVLQMVFNEQSHSLHLARFCGNDEYPVVVRGNQQMVDEVQKYLETVSQLYRWNNESLVADEEKRKEKEYVEKWWENRKRIEKKYEEFLEEVENGLISPLLFLFHPWNHHPALKQCIDEIMPLFGNDKNIRFFLSCNRKPLTGPSFFDQLECLSLNHSLDTSVFQTERLTSFFYQYNLLISKPVLSQPVILCLSPELQNIPFESVSLLERFEISRDLCLDSISRQEQLLQEYLLLSPGSYLLDISI